MKSSTLLRLTVALLAPSLPAAATAAKESPAEKPAAPAKQPAGKLTKVTPKDQAWLAKARESYPLKACLTSDEALGSMGENAEFIYQVEGKPDRLVMFCCAGCGDDFNENPAKYLAKLDAAAKKKSGK